MLLCYSSPNAPRHTSWVFKAYAMSFLSADKHSGARVNVPLIICWTPIFTVAFDFKYISQCYVARSESSHPHWFRVENTLKKIRDIFVLKRYGGQGNLNWQQSHEAKVAGKQLVSQGLCAARPSSPLLFLLGPRGSASCTSVLCEPVC